MSQIGMEKISLNLPLHLVQELDEYTEKLRAERRDTMINRSDAIRTLLIRGLHGNGGGIPT